MSLLPRLKFPSAAFRFLRDKRGVVGVIYGLMLIPSIMFLGVVVDYAREVQYKTDLQNVVDEAAIAGAAAFLDPTQAANAVTVATNYFNAASAVLPPSTSLSTPTITSNVSGTINPALGTANAYTVTVSANGNIATTFLSLIYSTLNISATGTAGNPVIQPQLVFSNVGSQACDGNTVYLYQVPKNGSGSGYNFDTFPTFSVSNGVTQGNYYWIGSSYAAGNPNGFGKAPTGQTLPTFNVNQPLGVMLQNDTNGNTSNPSCGAAVTGANSYGAPNGSSQAFYSSLLGAGDSPSDNTNYSYTAKITTSKVGVSCTANITAAQVTLPASILNPGGIVINEPIASSPYNVLATYLGINDPGSGFSNCTSSKSGCVTTYTCQTQYYTAADSATPNCSLYVATGVTFELHQRPDEQLDRSRRRRSPLRVSDECGLSIRRPHLRAAFGLGERQRRECDSAGRGVLVGRRRRRRTGREILWAGQPLHRDNGERRRLRRGLPIQEQFLRDAMQRHRRQRLRPDRGRADAVA